MLTVSGINFNSKRNQSSSKSNSNNFTKCHSQPMTDTISFGSTVSKIVEPVVKDIHTFFGLPFLRVKNVNDSLTQPTTFISLDFFDPGEAQSIIKSILEKPETSKLARFKPKSQAEFENYLNEFLLLKPENHIESLHHDNVCYLGNLLYKEDKRDLSLVNFVPGQNGDLSSYLMGKTQSGKDYLTLKLGAAGLIALHDGEKRAGREMKTFIDNNCYRDIFPILFEASNGKKYVLAPYHSGFIHGLQVTSLKDLPGLCRQA